MSVCSGMPWSGSPAERTISGAAKPRATCSVVVRCANARQGALIAGLGVAITAEQEAAVWDVMARLQKDLDTIS